MQPHTNSIEAYHLLHNGILALARAEQQGIRVDVEYLDRKHAFLNKKISRLERKFEESKFYKDWEASLGKEPNPNSGPQLAKFLYEVKGLKPPKLTDTGKGSVDKEAITTLNIPELNGVLQARKLRKIRDTYLDGFKREQVKGVIHPFFNLHLVKTYRSCVAKGTKILVLRNFIDSSKGVPIETIQTGDYVYCFDDDLKPAISKVLWAGKTGYREVVRVHYSVTGGGKGFLDVTPEHKIRLIDGTYEQAQNLVGDFRKPYESKHVPKIRTLSCKRAGDKLNFTGHLKHGKGVQESHIVYAHFYGDLCNGDIIHHKDHNHMNHTPKNLEKMTLSSHSSYHGNNLSEEAKKRYAAHLAKIRPTIKYKKGVENPLNLRLSKFHCLRTLAEHGGQLTKVPYDFDTFKRHLKRHNINPKNIKLRYNHKGLFISKGLLKKLEPLGRSEIQTKLGVNYYTIKELLRYYKLDAEKRKWANQFGTFVPGNHVITKIEWIKEKVDVYDIEVEDYHNFFANEICVHNSSSNPNFQNIPKRDKEAMRLTRGALFPREGHQLLEVDYGQLEVRIAACYTQDKRLIHDILNGDMHADMAKELFIIDDFDKDIPEHDYLRAATKNGFVFPEFYGSYYKNTADDLAYKWGELSHGRWRPGQGVSMPTGTLADHFISKGIKSYDQFVKHVQRIENEFWNVRYREYTRWKEKWWKMYQKNGYIETFTGFRCTEIMGKNDAINYPIQGAAFHCLLWSLIEVDKMLQIMGWRSRIIGQIHDSIVLDVYPPELPMLIKHVRQITTVKLPEAWEWINVPLDVDFEICDVDASWAEKRKM